MVNMIHADMYGHGIYMQYIYAEMSGHGQAAHVIHVLCAAEYADAPSDHGQRVQESTAAIALCQ
jgi:hypothetical protein